MAAGSILAMPCTLGILSTSPWWLDVHAGAIQAICAVFALAGLFWYCILTLQIREASLRQASAAVRPFVVIDELKDADHPDFQRNLKPISKDKIYIIRNLGKGPAMDIRWVPFADAGTRSDVKWIELGDLAVGDWSHVFDDSPTPQMMYERPNAGMTFLFTDSAGTKHETVDVMDAGVFCQRCRLQAPKRGF